MMSDSHVRQGCSGTSLLNESNRSMLPIPATSKLKRPAAVAKVLPQKKSTGSDGPGVKRVKYQAVGDENAKPKNPLLTRVGKKKGRKSITSTAAKKYGTANSSAKPSTSTSNGRAPARSAAPAIKPKIVSTSGPKKSKRSPWDYKGQLEDMKETLANERAALEAEKQRSLQTEQIIQRIEALENERKVIQVQNTNLSGDVRERENEISRLTSELNRARDEHEREVRALRLDVEDGRRDLRKVRDERDELDLQIRAARKQIRELEEKFSNLESEHKLLQEESGILKKNIEDMGNTIEQQENDLKTHEADRKRLLNEVQELKGNIRVFCRVRPNLKDEDKPAHINYEGQAGKSLNVTNNNKESKYVFDKVFGPQATQSEIYEELDQLVQSTVDGYNVCVFAYGQTGSGKTYTMEGPDNMTDDNCGVIPRAMKQIFVKCQDQKKHGWQYELAVEHVEIYCEILQDLLRSGKEGEKLEIRTKTPSGETAIWVPNLSRHKVENYSDVKKLLSLSKKRRATAQTAANDHSSRSHSVFILRIKSTNVETGQETESALNLIDLAGSERCGETGATGQRLKEGNKINASLTNLACVISALANKDQHVPYRNSKLTLLLRESLGGNSKTLMIVNINPSPNASSETTNTLRFATNVNQCNIGTAQKVVKF